MLHGTVMTHRARASLSVRLLYLRLQLSVHTMHNATDLPPSVQLAVLTRNQRTHRASASIGQCEGIALLSLPHYYAVFFLRRGGRQATRIR